MIAVVIVVVYSCRFIVVPMAGVSGRLDTEDKNLATPPDGVFVLF